MSVPQVWQYVQPGPTHVVVVRVADGGRGRRGTEAHVVRAAVADIGRARGGVGELVEGCTAADVAARDGRAAAEARGRDLIVEDRAVAGGK